METIFENFSHHFQYITLQSVRDKNMKREVWGMGIEIENINHFLKEI